MTESFRPDKEDDAPASEPSTLITAVSPALATAAEVAHAEDGRSPMPSPLGDDGPVPSPREHHTPGAPETGAAKKPRPKMTLRIPDDEVARPSKPVPSVPSPSTFPAVTATGTLSPSNSPPPPSASGVAAVTTHRIITLKKLDTPTNQIPISTRGAGPSPVTISAMPSTLLPAIPARPPSVVLPLSGEDTEPHGRKLAASPPPSPSRPPPKPAPVTEDSWTPFQPMAVETQDTKGPDSSLSVDIAVDSSPFDRPPSNGDGGRLADASSRAPAGPSPATFEAARELPSVALGAPPAPPAAPTASVSPAASVPPVHASAPPAAPSAAPSKSPSPAAVLPSKPPPGSERRGSTPPKSGSGADGFPEMVFDDNLFASGQHPVIEDLNSPSSRPPPDARSSAPRNAFPPEAPSSPALSAASGAPSAPPPLHSSVPSHPEPPSDAVKGPAVDAEVVSVDSDPDPSEPVLSEAVPSEPSEVAEISPEDVVSVEAVGDKVRAATPSAPPPPMRARAASVPSFAPPPPPPPAAPAKTGRTSSPSLSTATIKTSVPPEFVSPPPKPRPMVIVPASSPLAPPPMGDAAQNARKRARPWWEELFNDDFIRTMAKITDAQIGAEVDFIEESLGLDKGAMVLDLACGTGRHAIELTRRGYEVVGFDLSLSMLAKAADEAQERQQKLNFVQGDMREMTFEETFDGVYCWSTSFGFFEEEKNAAVIANVRRALKPGGQVLLDVVNRDFVAQQSPSLVWFEGDGCVCMDDMIIDWITSRMKVKRTMMMDDGRSREIEYSIRLYALHELGKLLHENGFRVVQVSGRVATPGVFFGAHSPRTLILAEKK